MFLILSAATKKLQTLKFKVMKRSALMLVAGAFALCYAAPFPAQAEG